MGMNLAIVAPNFWGKAFRGTGWKGDWRRNNGIIMRGTTWLLLSPESLSKPISKNTSNSMDSPLSSSEEKGLGDCVRKAQGPQEMQQKVSLPFTGLSFTVQL